MEILTTWFTELDPSLKIFWGCAIVASVIFAVQLVLLMIGLDSDMPDADVDVTGFDSLDIDGDTTDAGGGLTLFSVKNLINFLMGFGWAGVCFYGIIENAFLLYVVSVIVGCLFVVMFVLIYKQTRKLESNGAFKIKECKGKTAQVYLRIPANGKGKIQISINGSVHELNAVSGGKEIATGATVTVLDVVDGETVVVG